MSEDRARKAFGQSLASEVWAVRANELAWRARKARLIAFQAHDQGTPEAIAFLESEARRLEAEHKDWERRMAEIINGQ